MLFGRPGFFAPFQAGEDAILSEQCLSGCPFHFDHFNLLNVLFRRNDVEVQVLSQHNDASAILKHVSRGPLHGIDGNGVVFG